MTMKLGQSSVILASSQQSSQSYHKKISNYIFRYEDMIGQGNFSKVYKGYHQLSNEQVAIKIIQLSSVKSSKLQQLLFSEIQVIQSLNHPNILKCYQVLKSQHNCYIITELCNGGDLQSVLKKNICLNQFQTAPYIRDIFQGLIYLGQRGIVHRDLKIANIFINNGVVKIADFGFAKYTQNHNFKDLDIGSPLYMSPEGMIDHIYGMKTDIWAFGVIIYELLHGQTIFANCRTQYDLKRAVSIPISQNIFRPDLNPAIRDLIIKCLNVNLQMRPDALGLINDNYLNKLLNINKNNHHNSNSPDKIISHSSRSINYITIDRIKQQSYYETNNISYKPQSVTYKHNQIHPEHRNSKNYQQNQIRQLNQFDNIIYSHQKIDNNDKNHSPARTSNTYKELKFPQNHDAPIFYTQPKIMIHNVQKLDNNQLKKSVKNENRSNGSGSLINHIQFLSPHRSNRNLPDQIQTSGAPLVKFNEKAIDYHSKSDTASVLSFSNHNKKSQKMYTSNNMSTNIIKSVSSNNLLTKMALDSNSVNDRLSHSNQNIYSSQHSNQSTELKDNIIFQSCPPKKIQKNQTSIDNQTSNSKKFGQIIKGDKTKDLGHVKIVTKIDKFENNQRNQGERLKSKSNITYDNNYQFTNPDNVQSLIYQQKHAKNIHNNQIQKYAPSNPIPNFLQSKIKNQQLMEKKNLISTIIQYKQAISILHYCRLLFKFITTLKKIKSFVHFRDLNFRSLQNPQTGDIFSRFLLTVLNQLSLCIRSKQIIYEGENYKKKQNQQQKLQDVVNQYYRKYYQELNKNRDLSKHLIPFNDKSTSIEWMKQFCEEIWQCLDKQNDLFKQKITIEMKNNQNFIKYFENICYLSVRLVEANQLIINCIRTKKYNPLSLALIQNWITEDYYKQIDYINARNKYFALLNQSNPLKMSQTNDTEDNNGRLDIL